MQSFPGVQTGVRQWSVSALTSLLCPGAIEAIALVGRDRQFGILNRRSSRRPTVGRTIRRVIQVGFGMSVLLPGVGIRANVATLPIRARSGHQQPRPKARRLKHKEIVNRAGPRSAIFPQHSVGSAGSPQMVVGEASMEGSRVRYRSAAIDTCASWPRRLKALKSPPMAMMPPTVVMAAASAAWRFGTSSRPSEQTRLNPPRSPGELMSVTQNRRVAVSTMPRSRRSSLPSQFRRRGPH